MKRSRFTERQIAFALQQAEAGTPVLEVCRKMGVTEQTFYRWRKEYGEIWLDQAMQKSRFLFRPFSNNSAKEIDQFHLTQCIT